MLLDTIPKNITSAVCGVRIQITDHNMSNQMQWFVKADTHKCGVKKHTMYVNSSNVYKMVIKMSELMPPWRSLFS